MYRKDATVVNKHIENPLKSKESNAHHGSLTIIIFHRENNLRSDSFNLQNRKLAA